MEPSNVLEVNHLTLSFTYSILSCRTVTALDDVSLKVRTGEIHALLGQDGAGKTTLMKVLGGLYPAKSYRGEIVLAGRPVVLRAPDEATRHGVAIIPRRPSVFANLNVAENIVMGRLMTSRKFLIDRAANRTQAEGILRELEVTLDLDARVNQLDARHKRLVALARALSTRPRLVVLDEPAAFGVAPAETSQLIRILRLFAGQNIASLYLTRDPEEAMLIADRITVLRDGTIAGMFERVNFDKDTLTQAMLSRQPDRGPGVEDDEVNDGVGGVFSIFRFLGLNSRR
ncbi:MAG: ATP-binding cassette domain-containing protein [Chloroflexi bacterium]|nr:ATP-binding cassette domain-containing protein [Chloroflexota bacterium]